MTEKGEFWNSFATLGQKYPPEFLDSLNQSGFDVLRNYLASHQAPPEVIGLVDDLAILQDVTTAVRCGKASDHELAHLVELVPDALSLIVELGGTFTSPAGESIARKPLYWRSKDAEAPAGPSMN